MSEKRNLRTAKMEQNMEHVLETWLANPPFILPRNCGQSGGQAKELSAVIEENETFMANYDLRCP